MISGRRRSVIFFIVLGACLVAIAVTLNIGWLVINWKEGVLAFLGLIFFLVIIAGLVLNTIFLVREIRRNEQHDSFINAVTHELKTPVASIRLYLQTLQSRDLDEDKRREFYRIMLEDSDRLLHTIDQVLRAGATGSRLRRIARVRLNLAEIARECVELARTRFHLGPDALAFVEKTRTEPIVLGDGDELKAAVWNLIDNAVKYSPGDVRDPGGDPGSGEPALRRPRDGSGRWDLAARVEADLPALLPHPRERRRPHQGQRPRALHRPLGCPSSWRPGVCRERGRRPREHVHAASPVRPAGLGLRLSVP